MLSDPLFLSRLQFAWVIAWHILLPAFTVGLASYIAVLEGIYFATGRDVYFRSSMFWIKIFSVSFGMGVVSGIVMPFQFGTNWSRFSDVTANVLSPLFAYEAIMAFFLESAFLGVLLFGRKLVPQWAHFFAALMVAFGTLLSSFWILSANSWMHTPVGYELVDGRFFPKDWFQIVFNPSFPYRLTHTIVAFYVTTAFVVAAVAAYLIRGGRFVEEGRVMFSMTLWLLSVLVPLQILLGDLHGLNTLEYQPAKLAAIESHWETASRVPLILFAIPDEVNETNRYSVEIPVLGSLILAHDPNAVIKGLKDWPPQGSPAGGDPVLCLPHHGRNRRHYARPRRGELVVEVQGASFRNTLVPASMPTRGPTGLRRRVGRVDHHRGGAPALDRLRPAPHRGFGLSVPDGHGCLDFSGRIYLGVSHHFPRGAFDHGPTCPQRTGQFRNRRESY